MGIYRDLIKSNYLKKKSSRTTLNQIQMFPSYIDWIVYAPATIIWSICPCLSVCPKTSLYELLSSERDFMFPKRISCNITWPFLWYNCFSTLWHWPWRLTQMNENLLYLISPEQSKYSFHKLHNCSLSSLFIKIPYGKFLQFIHSLWLHTITKLFSSH